MQTAPRGPAFALVRASPLTSSPELGITPERPSEPALGPWPPSAPGREVARSGRGLEIMLIGSIEITHVLPCLADPAKIRFHAHPSGDLAQVLPYLNAVLRSAVYHHEGAALTFTREHRIICLHPQLVTGAKIDDIEDARAVLEWVRGLANDAWDRRAAITPCYERRQRLTPLAVYKLLPGTNCKRCRFPTCLAFAVEIAAERRSVIQCAPLFEPAQADKRQLLLSLLSDGGYEVPGAFMPPPGAE